jgi:hypothetical protein
MKEEMTYYMKRRNRFYFRGEKGKLSFILLNAPAIKYGEKFIISMG